MEKLLEIAKFIFDNYQAIITGIVGIFSAILAILLIIPGDQAEKKMQAIVDFLSKFSRK